MLLINDLLDCAKACQGQKARLFVDDRLYQANRSPGLPSAQLQDDLNRLDDWKEQWRMFFHPEKYSLSNNQNQQYVLYDYSLKRQVDLHTKSHSKCLGVDLKSNHLWNTSTCIHTEWIVKQCNSMLGFFKRGLQINNKDTKASTYLTLVSFFKRGLQINNQDTKASTYLTLVSFNEKHSGSLQSDKQLCLLAV